MKLGFIPIVFLLVIIAVVLTAIPNIFGGLEQTTNMTGDEYEPEYEGLTDLVKVDMAVLVTIGFFGLIGVLFVMAYIFLR